jgi:hypothetical protein
VIKKGPSGISPSGNRPGRENGKEELMNEEVAEVRDRVVGSGRLDAATLAAASALLEDPKQQR